MTKTPTEEAVQLLCAQYDQAVSFRVRALLVTTKALGAALSELSRLQAERDRAVEIIDWAREELHQRRVADWFPEGAHNAAEQMSEDMRLIGNRLADLDFSTLPPPVKEAEPEPVAWADPADLKTLASDAFDVVLTELTSSSTAWNSTPLYATPPALQARVEALETELISAARFMDIARRAIESGQVVDKDVHGTLCRARDRARAALTIQEETKP